MNIKIEQQSDHYRADCLDFPGSPPVGIGRTPELAVAALFWQAMFSSENWLRYIKRDEPIIINEELWKYTDSYYR